MQIGMTHRDKLPLVTLWLALLLLPGCDGGGSGDRDPGPRPPDYDPNALLLPTTEQEFQEYVIEGLKQWSGLSENPEETRSRLQFAIASLFDNSQSGGNLAGVTGALGTLDANMDAPPTATFSSESELNVLVAGVDELDAAPRRGEYLFLANGGHIQIVRAHDAGPAEIVSTVAVHGPGDGTSINGLYLYGSDSESILASISGDVYRWSNVWYEPWYWSNSTTLHFLDVSTPDSAEITEWFEIDGNYVNSRRVGSTLYLITRFAPVPEGMVRHSDTDAERRMNRQLIRDLNIDRILPRIRFPDGSSAPLVSASECFIPPIKEDDGFHSPTVTTVTAIDMRSPSNFQSLCMAENVTGIYVSQQAIYLSAHESTISSFDVAFSTFSTQTIIHKIAIDGSRPQYVASGRVPGQFWGDPAFLMGEQNGYLTAVTSRWTDDGRKHLLSVLGPSVESFMLEVVGQIPNASRPSPIGKMDEQIYASRIMGERAYVVTFKKIDPVYVIDLSIPSDPRILGELEIPGFSSYLHPIGDNLLLGVGKDADDQGSFAWFQGVIVRLFDVGNPPNVTVLAEVPIGRRPSETPVRWDHHSFTIVEEGGVHRIAIPVSVHGAHVDEVPDSPSYYYPWTENALYLLELNEFARSLDVVGRVIAEDQYTGDRDQPNCCSWNGRSYLSGDTVHFLSKNRLFTSSWQNPAERSSLFIPTLFGSGLADGQIACTENLVPSIRIYAQDRDSGNELSCELWTVDGIDATFSEYCSGVPRNELYETPGVFSLTVNAEGYVPWQTDDVHVQEDDCHVGTVRITVPMTRQ